MHTERPRGGPVASGGRSRWRTLWALAAAAAAAHLVALSGLQWAWPQADAAPLPAMQVRAIAETIPVRPLPSVTTPSAASSFADAPVPPPPQAGAAAVVAAAVATTPAAAAKLPRLHGSQAVLGGPAELPTPAAHAAMDLVGSPAPAPAPSAGPSLALAAGPAPSALVTATSPAESDEAIPPYQTRIPPPLSLSYRLQRGLASGTGELRWQPSQDRYELTLEARIGAAVVSMQSSQGGFDAAGLAPVRFTERRAHRPAAAANFQREAGKITFSGPSREYLLRPGSQDRLSWMLQLSAIVAAEPSLRVEGAKVVMNMVGANGDVGVWAFICRGAGTVDAASGPIETLAYVREPHGPYDTRAEAWLDPARLFLPVRAAWKAGANDEGFDLQLQEVLANAAPRTP